MRDKTSTCFSTARPIWLPLSAAQMGTQQGQALQYCLPLSPLCRSCSKEWLLNVQIYTL